MEITSGLGCFAIRFRCCKENKTKSLRAFQNQQRKCGSEFSCGLVPDSSNASEVVVYENKSNFCCISLVKCKYFATTYTKRFTCLCLHVPSDVVIAMYILLQNLGLLDNKRHFAIELNKSDGQVV